MQQTARTPLVRLVRGPLVRLSPHQDHCSTEEELQQLCARLREDDPAVILAADLFCGAGGLSLGLEQAGIKVVLGADHDPEALETHRHHIGGMAVDWDLGDAEVIKRIAQTLLDNQIDVLAGGPPCQPFSKAGRSRMRYLVRQGVREAHDRRRDLWVSFLEVAKLARPRAIVMENVPDMALDREMFILRSVVYELENLGYSVHQRVVEAWRYGVPQFRQRLILVAIRDRADFSWPDESPRKVTLSNAISDLPAVEGGWRPAEGAKGWIEYAGPRTDFQREMRSGMRPRDAGKVFDHITRPVRPDDAEAFMLLDSESRYSDLPAHLKRYRDDIFDDKYKRLAGNDISRTITAHIAKDGYWYIHPEQNRTITVREAARIQTFPDCFRFAGSPSSAFRQIGNAVPPRLARAIGNAVVNSFGSPVGRRPSTEDVAEALTQWFDASEYSSQPWLRSGCGWSVILGEVVFDRLSPLAAMSIWPILSRYRDPAQVLRGEFEIGEVASWLGRADRIPRLLTIAEQACAAEPDRVDQQWDLLVTSGAITQATADLAELVDGGEEQPVIASAGALRVASRFFGNDLGLKNQRSDGRISIASMIGFSSRAGNAQLAILELAADVCTPARPACPVCPLQAMCITAINYSPSA